MWHTRVYVARTPRKEKQTKWRRKLPSLGVEEIQFLSSVSLPNLRQAPGENLLDSDYEYEDYTSDSNDGSENILEKSYGKDASDTSNEHFSVRRLKSFEGEKGVELRKSRWWRIRKEKRKDVPKIYFLWGRTEIEWRAAAKTVKWMSKHSVKKSYALINHCHFFHCNRK